MPPHRWGLLASALKIGPLSISWDLSTRPELGTGHWVVRPIDPAPVARGPRDARWFNDDEWSGVETAAWTAWVSNRDRCAALWASSSEAAREALSVVIPGALRREGVMDAHGAVIAPDPARPDDAVFVTGLSGAGKSTLAMTSALGGARFVADDSAAIGLVGANLVSWPRRSSMSLTPDMARRVLRDRPRETYGDKDFVDGRDLFPAQFASSLTVRAVAFLERGPGQDTQVSPVSPSLAYRQLLMGHPILAVDRGARRCFDVVRRLAALPSYRVAGGTDLLEPAKACSTLSALLSSTEAK